MTPNPELLDHLIVESVDRLRLRIKVADTDHPPTFRAIIEQIVIQVVGELDSLTLTSNPVFLLDQKTHDTLFQTEWNYVGYLMDKIASECFLRWITNMPLSADKYDKPDVQLTITVDIPRGCRTFTYTLKNSGEFERLQVTSHTTLTLDTNVVRDKWESRCGVEAVNRLLELSLELPISLRVTERIREDVPKPKLSYEIDRLPELGIRIMGSVIRPHNWRAGIDYPGSTEFSKAYAESTTLDDRQEKRDWKDWDHLHAHYVSKRDVFLTSDCKFRRKARHLTDKLGIAIMNPEEFIATIESAEGVGTISR